MVPFYNKYCRDCINEFDLPDDREWQKTNWPRGSYEEWREAELQKDGIDAEDPAVKAAVNRAKQKRGNRY